MRMPSIVCLLLSACLLAGCGGDAPSAALAPAATHNAWIRLGPPDAMMLAGYLRIDNPSNQPMRLRAIESDAFGAISVHTTELVDGVSRMRELHDFTVPAGGRMLLEPGAMHLMLMQPSRNLSEGDEVALKFTWAQGEATLSEVLPFVVRREPPAN